ncbi:MAG: hypothetical protein ACKOAG_04760 [Candidatus Kapaibacterium sp.]
MDAAHLHLLLNHAPIVGTVIGTVLLAWAVITRQASVRAAAASVLVAMALVAIPVYLSGEPAEESVEELPGVSEAFIEDHEDAAKWSLVAMEVAGALALSGIVASRKGHPLADALGKATLVVGVITCVLMARTGNLGGQIRHTEIRAGSGSTEGAGAIDHGTPADSGASGQSNKSAGDDD